MPNDRNDDIEESNIPINEDAPLLKKQNKKTKPAFFTAVEGAEAAISGASKMYATFGPIAIMYYQGYWLIAPLGFGVVTTVSKEVFAQLKEKYPENDLIQKMEKAAKLGNRLIVEPCKDFGFSLSLTHSIAQLFSSKSYFNPGVARIAAMASSGTIAASLSGMELLKENLRVFDIASTTIKSMYASNFGLELLKQQGVIEENSLLPVYVASGLGMLGLFAGYLKKDYPKASLMLTTIIEVLCANPSLAALFFAIPNDLYAASNPEHDISDSFFFTNAGIAILYLLLLTVSTGYSSSNEWKKINKKQAEEVVAKDEKNDSSRELSTTGFFMIGEDLIIYSEDEDEEQHDKPDSPKNK